MGVSVRSPGARGQLGAQTCALPPPRGAAALPPPWGPCRPPAPEGRCPGLPASLRDTLVNRQPWPTGSSPEWLVPLENCIARYQTVFVKVPVAGVPCRWFLCELPLKGDFRRFKSLNVVTDAGAFDVCCPSVLLLRRMRRCCSDLSAVPCFGLLLQDRCLWRPMLGVRLPRSSSEATQGAPSSRNGPVELRATDGVSEMWSCPLFIFKSLKP